MEQWLRNCEQQNVQKKIYTKERFNKVERVIQKLQNAQELAHDFYEGLIRELTTCHCYNILQYFDMEKWISQFQYLRNSREDLIDESYDIFGDKFWEDFYRYDALEDVITFMDEYYHRLYGKNNVNWFSYWVHEWNCEWFTITLNDREVRIDSIKKLIALMKGEIL